MASGTVTSVMVALSVAALLLFISAMAKVVRRGEWSLTATVLAAVVILSVSFVELTVTYLGKWEKVVDVYNNTSWMMPGVAHFIWRIFTLILGAGALVVFIVRARRRDATLNAPAVLYALLVIMSFGSSILNGDNPLRPVSLVFFLTVLACTVGTRGVGVHLGIGAIGSVAAIASGFTFLVSKDFSVFACTPTKCGPMGFNFQGILENENALALYLALAMPFVWIAFDTWEGRWLCAFMVLLAVLTGSRTGAGSAVATFVVLLLTRPSIRRPSAAPIRTRLLYGGLAALAVVGIALPFTVSDPSAYHARAYIWLLARDGISDPGGLLYGRGVLGWQHVAESGLLQNSETYSVHNQWLQVLFSTGLIGFALYVAVLAVLLWRARGAYSLVAGCVLTPVFVISVTEQPWPIDTTVWLTWVIPGALLCYPDLWRRRAASDRQPALVSAEPAPSSSGPQAVGPADVAARGATGSPV